MADGLTACGVDVEEGPEKLVVNGKGAGNKPNGGVSITTHGDHRIAMSFLVLGTAAKEAVQVDEAEMIKTSFPNFTELMTELGASIVNHE